ncbi:MAG: ribose 5-phosphate isomerase B [Planctomycetes bacterium]|nr:ribose 5-phosphate isomerase B [Planctomycetota bacterium]
MKIALASDHRGFSFKNKISMFIQELGYGVVDCGTSNGTDSVDYTDYGIEAARSVSRGDSDRAILICGTGLGMSLIANKVKGIRATVCHDLHTIEMSRRHNDANVLCLGADVVDQELMEKKIKLWIETPFEGGRHARRVNKIMRAEGD